MKSQNHPQGDVRKTILCALAFGLPAAGLSAAGTGTAEDPFTGEDVAAVMDGGATDTPTYYLIDADTDFGSDIGIYIGEDNPENNLDVTNAVLGGYLLRLGDTSESNDNVVSISDSTLTFASSLRVGNLGSGNAMTVSGASAISTGVSGYASVVGNGALDDPALGCENSLTISGPGITWTNTSALAVGNYGSGNTFELSGGATMSATDFVVGMGDPSDPDLGSDNEVLISGADTVVHFDNTGCVGNFGSDNSMTISDGARVEFGEPIDLSDINKRKISYIDRNYFYVGYGFGEDGQMGSGNSLLISGAGSVLELNMNTLYLGYDGTNNIIEMEDMAALNTMGLIVESSGGVFQMSSGAKLSVFEELEFQGTNNMFVCEGAGSTVNAGYGLYLSGESNALIIAYGATANFEEEIYISGADSAFGAIGEGAVVSTNNNIYLNGDDSFMLLGLGALAKADDGIYIDTDNGCILRMARGFLAMRGDWTDDVASMIEDGQFLVWDEPSYDWVPGTAENVTVKYYAQTEEIPGESPKDATASSTFEGYDGLIGYTLISAGDDPGADLRWAGNEEEYVSAVGDGWFTSPWYVPFYSTLEMEDWIYSSIHGWQYISYESSMEDGTYLWDDATASWWYTDAASYPYIYQFTMSSVDDGEGGMSDIWGGAWYYYRRGECPERMFWDFATDADVAEATLIP